MSGGLRATLEATMRPPTGPTYDAEAWKVYDDAVRLIEDLAPDAVALVLDMADALADVQWRQVDHRDDGLNCPICLNAEEWGHTETCPIGSFVARAANLGAGDTT